MHIRTVNMGETHTNKILRARKETVEKIFAGIDDNAIDRVLELGAGEGYQSLLLRRYVKSLTCTDIQPEQLWRHDEKIRYKQCDAEEVREAFPGELFELVYCSNMLQHTPGRDKVLAGVSAVLIEPGVFILVVPNIWWKLFKLGLFYPTLIARLLSRVFRTARTEIIGPSLSGEVESAERMTNNPKFTIKRGRFRRALFPVPLGAYRGNIEELFAFRKQAWIDQLTAAGFEVVRLEKGPFLIGDLNDSLNLLLERIGFCSEWIFISRKAGVESKLAEMFPR